MITINYDTIGEGLKKPEHTKIKIWDGRYFASYDVPNKARTTVEQMKKDGKRGVLYSRGQMIQILKGKTEEEILEIVKKDIENGLIVAEKKTGKKLEVINMEVNHE